TLLLIRHSMSRLLTLILAYRFGVKFSGEFNYTFSSCCLFFIPQRSTRPNVNASPLKNIAELKNVQFVMKAGLIYKQ
ncbi:hypothetical protein, partial [Pseudoalteromonas sp. JB197]|uniref:hypothetical protein n=1 Tax=Pseudoalteromonas sp. JB197 TaxID=1434839 RepID=UPI001C3DD844